MRSPSYFAGNTDLDRRMFSAMPDFMTMSTSGMGGMVTVVKVRDRVDGTGGVSTATYPFVHRSLRTPYAQR
ncbi:MAG: hypothetical protein Q8Q09_28435 [Deltaproteobacteria bacterium]|nr:hypothetical protein [Deltaproteobacteria bacterium]